MLTIPILAALTVFQVDPWFHKPILPDADPEQGVVTDTLAFAAAKGETEAVSFVVNPDRDLPKVDVVPSDLTGPGGAKIPASAADVALVKVWYRPGGRWNSSWAGGAREPINNLVLHDDALVRVDWETKTNYLRADYPDGPTYLDISRKEPDTPFFDDLEPVRDAPKFVPFDLKKGFRQQYLVTWKVPKDAAPGDYKGTISLSTPNSQLLTLNLSLTVHPFELPPPRTHYDTREPYVSFWMGTPNLEGLVRGGGRLDRAERKLRAVYRSMAAHNAVNLSGVGDLTTDSTDDLAVRSLIIARQEGLSADPLINGSAYDTRDTFVRSRADNPLKDPEKNADDYRASLARYRDFVSRQSAVMDRYLGHHRCYYQSVDECDHTTNRRSYGYWGIIHELGGFTWTDSAFAGYNGAFVDLNDVPAAVNHEVAWDWRRSGAKAATYAATFTGPENPDLWRRIKGLRFWYADYDGQHEYCFFNGYNRWNDFVYRGKYCMFGIVYLTEDGLVSTLAWEAVREALDDVRYFTLLRLRAQAALRSDDPETRRLGRRALVWQDGVDPEYVKDLNAFRRETVRWIEQLIAKVGPEPSVADTELPPPAVLPPDGRWKTVPKPSAGARAVLDFAEKAAADHRHDLALAALEGFAADAAAETSDRVRVALRACDLRLELRERGQAVAAVERALALKGLSGFERAKLSLKRVTALMTEAKYQEAFTVEHLDRVEKALAEALRLPGASEEERFAAIERLTDDYLTVKEYAKCQAFAAARLGDTKLSGAHQAQLHIFCGKAWRGLEQWEKAMKSFKEAHRANNNEKDAAFLLQILDPEAVVAEKLKDYVHAVNCWLALTKLYDELTEMHRIRRAQKNAERLQELIKKDGGAKIKVGSMDDDSSDAISLDE